MDSVEAILIWNNSTPMEHMCKRDCFFYLKITASLEI